MAYICVSRVPTWHSAWQDEDVERAKAFDPDFASHTRDKLFNLPVL